MKHWWSESYLVLSCIVQEPLRAFETVKADKCSGVEEGRNKNNEQSGREIVNLAWCTMRYAISLIDVTKVGNNAKDLDSKQEEKGMVDILFVSVRKVILHL